MVGAPGLYKKERHLLGPVIAITSFFFIGGALFGYFVVFPSGFKFLLGFGTDYIRTLPSMREYLNFATKLLFIFGLLFELPVALTGLARLGIVSVEYLKRNRKYAVILAFVAGAFLTPDVVSMILMALPLMVLYEIGILGAHVVSRPANPGATPGGHGPEAAPGVVAARKGAPDGAQRPAAFRSSTTGHARGC